MRSPVLPQFQSLVECVFFFVFSCYARLAFSQQKQYHLCIGYHVTLKKNIINYLDVSKVTLVPAGEVKNIWISPRRCDVNDIFA